VQSANDKMKNKMLKIRLFRNFRPEILPFFVDFLRKLDDFLQENTLFKKIV
jgi:hypothetical protein